MYTYALYVDGIKPNLECSRGKAMDELRRFFFSHDVATIFAYNATFDYRHLPELRHLAWYDIMKLGHIGNTTPKFRVALNATERAG